MTNYEYHKKHLEKIWLAGRNTAVDNEGNLTPCGPESDCRTCIFSTQGRMSCAKLREEWYKQEHVVELKDDLSNLTEYARSRDVVIDITDESSCIIGTLSPHFILNVRKVLTPYYIEFGVTNRYITAEDIKQAIDILHKFFPEKEETV